MQRLPSDATYIDSGALNSGALLYADVRGKLIPVAVRKAPYITQRYVR